MRAYDRRVHRASFRLPERRTGFARRLPAGGAGRFTLLLEAYRDRPGLIALAIGMIVGLSAADLLLTLRALDLGAVELNPAMAWLLEVGPWAAAAFKLSTALAVGAVTWAMRRYRRILEASLLLAGIMTAVLVHHAVGAIVLSG